VRSSAPGSTSKARRLVGGPGVFICERCVGLATDVISTGSQAETPIGVLAALSDEHARERCSFCGKRRTQVSGLAGTGAVAICSECLQICEDIVTERLA